MFDCRDINELIDYVMTETWIEIGGCNFQQTEGIAMGANCSPLIANLTLAWMEYEYFIRPENAMMLKNGYIRRYIDDVLAINISNFEEVAKQIYGDDLPIERTNTTDYECQYLDLHLILKPEFSIKVYDKTRDFDFPVIKYAHPKSAVHSRVILGTFYSQLVRFVRICSKIEDFIANAKMAITILSLKGVPKESLVLTLSRFCESFIRNFVKYGLFDRKDISSVIIADIVSIFNHFFAL